MADQIIKISVDVNGEAKIEAEGFQGKGCKDATKVYEALYSNLVSSQDKPELHAAQGVSAGQISVH